MIGIECKIMQKKFTDFSGRRHEWTLIKSEGQ